MLRTVVFNDKSGKDYNLFLVDADFEITGERAMTVADMFERVEQNNPGLSFKLMSLEGNIGTFSTKCYGLVVFGDDELDNITDFITQFLIVPETASKMLLSNFPEAAQKVIVDALDCIKFYESIKGAEGFVLPERALSELPELVAKKMSAAKKKYSLKATDNQEIFQTSFDSEYGIVLPELEDIADSPEDRVSALDILRVSAPYREGTSVRDRQYRSIYHTPYYKISTRIQGHVPESLNWLNGRASNNMMDIMPNELHMVSNLKNYICSDISRSVAEMASCVFFSTNFGSILFKLFEKRDLDVMHHILDSINKAATTDVYCDISFSDIDELYQNGWYAKEVVRKVKEHLYVSNEFLLNEINNRPVVRRVLDCNSLPFVLTLTPEQEDEFTELFINQSYITRSMQRFLVDICKKAYRVHWGHTGATLAIPGFVPDDSPKSTSLWDTLNSSMVKYLNDRYDNKGLDPVSYRMLFINSMGASDDDSFSDDDSADEIYSRLDYYVDQSTIERIRNGSLPANYFSTDVNSIQTSEQAVIEYWQHVNGEDNLEHFLLSSFLNTGDVSVFVDGFIKLMRWGERRPNVLVFSNHPEIRDVFDLTSGECKDNTIIVSEDDLIRHNGCEYYLTGFLTTSSNSSIPKDRIIGFSLQKEYKNVKKDFIASWLDVGELIANSEKGGINIGDFITVSKLDRFEVKAIEDYSGRDFDFYVSDSNVKSGLESKVPPKDFSALALLTQPGVLNSRGYIESLANDKLLSLKDRQYDILRRYVSTLGLFYQQYSDEISQVDNSVGLGNLAVAFWNLFNSSGEAKPDNNKVVSSSAIQNLNFDSPSTFAVQFDTTELKGPFMILSAPNSSPIPPVVFANMNDARAQSVANMLAKKNEKIVLLLMRVPDKYIFCRKDLAFSDLQLKDATDANGRVKKVISHKSLDMFKSGIDNIKAGKYFRISKVPVVLHKSVEPYIDLL